MMKIRNENVFVLHSDHRTPYEGYGCVLSEVQISNKIDMYH